MSTKCRLNQNKKAAKPLKSTKMRPFGLFRGFGWANSRDNIVRDPSVLPRNYNYRELISICQDVSQYINPNYPMILIHQIYTDI